ncbi:CPBP family intramembrane metalloprotease [Candidatus Bathyarchaeota archaeon]|nr:CPBP family intramembrane metalloprotease [Candidatus Bathyarchaeota archaeon]
MDDRGSALLALSVFAVDRAAVALLNLLRGGMSQPTRMAYLNLTTLVFVWGLPLLAVYRVEGRGAESLGLRVPRGRYLRYALYCFVGFVLPGVFLGFSVGFVSELLEQILFIGLAEEFFYRGYLMTRLCDWLGGRRGLLLNAVVFSLAHATFLLTRYGLSEVAFTLTSVAQTFLGGILMGYIYQKSGNIVPGTVLHTSMNLWLSRL